MTHAEIVDDFVSRGLPRQHAEAIVPRFAELYAPCLRITPEMVAAARAGHERRVLDHLMRAILSQSEPAVASPEMAATPVVERQAPPASINDTSAAMNMPPCRFPPGYGSRERPAGEAKCECCGRQMAFRSENCTCKTFQFPHLRWDCECGVIRCQVKLPEAPSAGADQEGAGGEVQAVHVEKCVQWNGNISREAAIRAARLDIRQALARQAEAHARELRAEHNRWKEQNDAIGELAEELTQCGWTWGQAERTTEGAIRVLREQRKEIAALKGRLEAAGIVAK